MVSAYVCTALGLNVIVGAAVPFAAMTKGIVPAPAGGRMPKSLLPTLRLTVAGRLPTFVRLKGDFATCVTAAEPKLSPAPSVDFRMTPRAVSWSWITCVGSFDALDWIVTTPP